MTRFFFRILVVLIAVACVLGIAAFIFFPAPWKTKKSGEETQARIVIPRNSGVKTDDADNTAEILAALDRETIDAKVPLDEGEVIVSVLNGSFDSSPYEKQMVAYRNLLEIDSPIYLAFVDYDERSRSYRRAWNVPTAATLPGTISLYTMDLLGDRSVCVILTGVNSFGEHTITIFRMNPAQSVGSAAAGRTPFEKIAELRIDGTISIKEITRSQAYQMGFGKGETFTIAGYGRDFESANILDQVEIVYKYNPINGLYEQSSITRIPGAQVEQRRVRELLGDYKAFEEFISGLWYHMTPQGTIDRYQYIYFDPPSREIIFYGGETQQVFNWQGSTATRYGLYISSQNIRISTLRRTIDIELESLESIRVRVIEDVRLKIGVNAPWDGSYRKANQLEPQAQKPQNPENAHIEAWYDGSIGKIHFSSDGSYELSNRGNIRQGKYAFFFINDREFLELRATERGAGDNTENPRETYMIEPERVAGENRKTLTLNRVRIGARGVERLQEAAVTLTLASE